MAVALEFISLLIRIETLEGKYPGGWDQCRGDHPFCWHDDKLFRDGVMSPMDALMIVNRWKNRGFKLYKVKSGVRHWNEVCLVDRMVGPTMPCDWIDVDLKHGIAFLSGSDPGAIAGPR